jgi:hypothetical protein
VSVWGLRGRKAQGHTWVGACKLMLVCFRCMGVGKFASNSAGDVQR